MAYQDFAQKFSEADRKNYVLDAAAQREVRSFLLDSISLVFANNIIMRFLFTLFNKQLNLWGTD